MKRTFRNALALVLVLVLTLALGVPALATEAGAPLDRAGVVQRLYEQEGSPMVIQGVVFADAAGTPWANAAVWAHGAGVTKGSGNGLFHGERAVTRAELVTMLHRYARYKGIDVSVGEDTNILSYNDAFDLPEWSYPGFQWACGAGLITDVNGNLLPDGTVTAAELDSILACIGDGSAQGFGWQHFHELTADAALSYWTPESETRQALTAYMAAITDPQSADYIPVEDRIAVFDFDGTLFCETDPNYFDYMLLKYRVLDDPDYKDKASDFERETANKIKEQNETGKSFDDLPVNHGKAVASAFAGMTLKEFNAYIQEFKKQPMPSYTGMTRGSGFYLPMVQIVEYLQANDFTVYIVSGTDRLIVRGIFDGNILNIPNSQIIGSDETIVAKGQGDADGLDYFFTPEDELILGGDFLIKNLKMNKVAVIAQEIGRQPVLSFGNSSGDNSMAEYVVTNNPHRALAFMLCCDDLERENGNLKKAQSMADSCAKYGWIPVSMKNDWTTIYGPNVTYLNGSDALEEIKDRGVLRVGATGDYRPMSFRDSATGEYQGFDAALAEELAKALGVELEYVPTTWPTLMEDTLAGKFDLALCGITVTDARKEQALMSDGYLGNGKTVLCRAEDAGKYTSLEAINHPEVTVMENPGGLNEKFARENLPDAKLVIHDVNEEIPGLVAAGEADVMITEILEAAWYIAEDARLAAPLLDAPFTHGELGILMPKGSETLLDWVNAFLAQEKADGRLDALAQQYIYRGSDGAALPKAA